MQAYVYILASQRNGTLYTGVTSNLIKRIWQHKNDVVQGFSEKYNTHLLVWYEVHEAIDSEFCVKNRLKNGKGPGNWN